jgi:hypothetical protein
MQAQKTLVVIGGGAAGFFAAINAARLNPEQHVILLEKSDKLLSKVRISGGGRCNVTHACFDNRDLVRYYPRGDKELRGAFSRFSVGDTITWFYNRGVELKVEDDGRMFPVTDSSQTIINCFLDEAQEYGVEIRLKTEVLSIAAMQTGGFRLGIADQNPILCDHLVVAAGGHPKASAYRFLEKIGHRLIPPAPSLFTFNMPNDTITKLMGLSVQSATVRVQGTNLEQEGPLLITHWGMSGPAILKTSAVGARVLAEKGYQFSAFVNWLPHLGEQECRLMFQHQKTINSRHLVRTGFPRTVPRRLWEWITEKAGISDQLRWADLSNHQLQFLCEICLNDLHHVRGKTTFKEEFVTAGGIALEEVDFKTMESRKLSGLFFAGEVLDIDGLTGGFNFQAAWTTAWIAACSAAGVDNNSAAL